MNRFLFQLARIDTYQDPLRHYQARNVVIVAVGLMLVATLLAVSELLGPQDVIIAGIAVTVALASAAAIWLVRAGQVQQAGLPIVGITFLALAGVLFVTEDAGYEYGFLWIAIVLATAISSREIVLTTGVASIVILTLVVPVLSINPDTSMLRFANLVILTLMITGLGWLISGDLTQVARQVASQSETRRLQLMEITNAVSSRMFSRLELEPLLSETVEMIRDRFDTVYHAQVFLIEQTSQDAVLRASTGEVGQQLIARRHRLRVGSQSVIGRVTALKHYVLASDTSSDHVHKRNELLPDTRTELALPLRIQDTVIGALDLQSVHANAFSEEDIEVFHTLADQIAIAIDNAQLLEQIQAQSNENRQLLRQEQHNREEIERLNRELAGGVWEEYLHAKVESPHQLVDLRTGETMDSPDTPVLPAAQSALQTGQVVIESVGDSQHVAVPIVVQGVSIATLLFEVPHARAIPPAIQQALPVIGNRVGIVAENARLFDSVQQANARQAQLNQITERFQGVSDMEELLVTAVSELAQALGAETGYIRLVSDSGTGSGSNGHADNFAQSLTE
ncbi:MAG: GAF domain-containing protein [Chloroflexi bacterium]|nr:GAF domain-containing protein [Chloroflexota bacterium]